MLSGNSAFSRAVSALLLFAIFFQTIFVQTTLAEDTVPTDVPVVEQIPVEVQPESPPPEETIPPAEESVDSAEPSNTEDPVVPTDQPVLEESAEDVPAEELTPEEPKTEEPVVEETSATKLSYATLMREISNIRTKKLPSKYTNEELSKSLDLLIAEEQKKLDSLPVDGDRKTQYLELLQNQKSYIENPAVQTIEDVTNVLSNPSNEAEIVDEPASFSASEEDLEIKGFEKEDQGESKLEKFIDDLFTLEKADATEEELLPTIDDVKADTGEVKIDLSISELAQSLNNNPVKILNYVKNNIDFEPYYGAKKGATGCLIEKRCNDIDTTSLTIALMRAAGIPARYKKGIAVVRIDHLAKTLGFDGTDKARNVYYAFAANDYPIYSITGGYIDENLADADLSNEVSFAVEWIFPEIFYEYDERGGNIDNELSFEEVSTTADVRAKFTDKYKKQWISIEPTLKEYNHTQNEIVPDTANLDSEDFWYGYLQYQGTLSPIEKLVSDLQSATGKDINQTQYQSTKALGTREFEILPSKLPYLLGEGEDSDGNNIVIENWSILPDARRHTVTLSLLDKETNEVIISKTYFGNEINNVEIDLGYKGATQSDQQIIDSYGGIHATPASLVQIVPYFISSNDLYEGTVPISIGDSLIMQFESRLGEDVRTNQKFSTAGNMEGIYVTLSKVQETPYLDSPSKIVLEGNAAMAREYLRKVQEQGDLLARVYDHSYNFSFARAVVTQNRVLTMVDNIPTTFDFSGLTIDSEARINDYSNRNNYKNHRKDFHLLWGLYASYYEGQVFTDLTGMEGISTVSGLRYAYANPGSYTVHIIDDGNESVIDSLTLSDNTKANMHADIADGNTIITPDKFVEKGIWRGILYISLDPEWTGTYAIGEQVGNGGWTVDGVQIAGFFDSGDYLQYFYAQSTNLLNYFAYQEDRYVDGIKCSLSQVKYNEIMNTPGWSANYGFPCDKETKQYGNASHVFILGSNGAKFYKAGDYSYWTTVQNVKTKLEADKNSNNLEGLSNIKLDGTFKFNPIAGTYSWFGHYGSLTKKNITAYYRPTSNQLGAGVMVYGDILSQLTEYHYAAQTYYCPSLEVDPNGYCGKQNWVLNKLGYPLNNRAQAAAHEVDWGRDTQGHYQDFVGGQVYLKTTWSNKSYYVPEPIATLYNSSEFAINGNRGSGGQFGFPTSNPKFKNNGYVLKQSFENGKGITWDTQSQQVSLEYAGKYYCDEINGDDDLIVAKAFFEGLWDGGSTALKGVLIFSGIAVGVGVAADLIFGTHGGIEVAGLLLVGGLLADAYYELVLNGGMDDLLNELETRLAYEIEHSNCTARKIYLLSRYSSEFVSYVMAFRGFNKLSTNTLMVTKGESVEAQLNAIRNSFNNQVKSTLSISDDAAGAYLDIAEKNYGNLVDDLVKNTGNNFNGQNLVKIANKAYYGLAYDDVIAQTNAFRNLINVNGGLNIEAVKHIKFGIYRKGLYDGGAHVYNDLERKITNGLIEARTTSGQSVTSLSQVTPASNGVLKLQLRYQSGGWKTNHTVFPSNITDTQWQSAILDVASGRIENSLTVTGRSSLLPNIDINVVFVNQSSNVIKTAYPIYP